MLTVSDRARSEARPFVIGADLARCGSGGERGRLCLDLGLSFVATEIGPGDVAEPWGRYNLGRDDVTMEGFAEHILRPVAQYTLPHNIMGTPAISLPLAVHSSGNAHGGRTHGVFIICFVASTGFQPRGGTHTSLFGEGS